MAQGYPLLHSFQIRKNHFHNRLEILQDSMHTKDLSRPSGFQFHSLRPLMKEVEIEDCYNILHHRNTAHYPDNNFPHHLHKHPHHNSILLRMMHKMLLHKLTDTR